MKLSKWEDFLLEGVLNETILYYSKPFEKILKTVKDPVSDLLLSIKNRDIEEDITLVDLGDKEGYISFSTAKKINKIWDGKGGETAPFLNEPSASIVNLFYNELSPIWNKGRSPLKIGRFVKKLFPDLADKEIERFSNKFISVLNKPDEEIIVVEGDDIKNWYLESNYFEKKSTLGGSCMRYSKCSDFLNIYSENPDVCKLVCVTKLNTDGEYKLVARSLVWKVENQEFDYFLDRQYTIQDSYVDKLREFAINMGYAYKTNNNHTDIASVTYNGENKKLDMQIKLNNFNFEYYPYMDTFKKLDNVKGILHNNIIKEGDGYILNKTDGSYEVITTKIYSEWHDEYYPEELLVRCQWLDDYILRSEAVQVTTGTVRYRGWYPEEYVRIMIDCWNDEYIFDNDAIYSNEYDGFILKIESVTGITRLNLKSNRLVVSKVDTVHEEDEDFVVIDRVSPQVLKNMDTDDIEEVIKKSLLAYSLYFNHYVPNIVKIFANIYRVNGEDIILTEEDFTKLQLGYERIGDVVIDKYHYNELLKKQNLHDKLLNLHPEGSERHNELINY